MKALLESILSGEDDGSYSDMIQSVHSWYLQQRQRSDTPKSMSKPVKAKEGTRFGGVGRVAVKKFRDYSERSMRFATLGSLHGLKTRDLIHSHSLRTGIGKKEILGGMCRCSVLSLQCHALKKGSTML